MEWVFLRNFAWSMGFGFNSRYAKDIFENYEERMIGPDEGKVGVEDILPFYDCHSVAASMQDKIKKSKYKFWKDMRCPVYRSSDNSIRQRMQRFRKKPTLSHTDAALLNAIGDCHPDDYEINLNYLVRILLRFTFHIYSDWRISRIYYTHSGWREESEE